MIPGLAEFISENCPEAQIVSGGREILVRCRFCGDSQKNLSDAHLYISLDENKPFYNCFKCRASGVINGEFLSSLSNSVIDNDLLATIKAKTNKFISKSKTVLGMKNFKLRYDWIDDNELNRAKRDYINRRLGLNLDYNELIRNKIVLSIYDLLVLNNINKTTFPPDVMDELNSSFLGALSINSCFVTMKNLRPGKVSKYIDHKYIDYPIYQQNDNMRRFYSIPTRINLLSPEPIQVHIAEGIFDVLGIFYNVCGGNREQNLYINCGDKSYNTVVKMLSVCYGLINCEFNFYIDNDVSNKEVYVNTLGRPYRFFRNTFPGEKDYGVSADRIQHTRVL